MKENRERLAWTVLLAAFAIFLACLLGIPFGAYQWYQHATVPPSMLLQALEGTAQVEHPDDPPRLVLGENRPVEIKPGSLISNDTDTETLLTIISPDQSQSLVTVQIYPSTQLEVSQARSPRFAASQAPHRVEITVLAGRIRLGLARLSDHYTDLRARTPHGQFLFWEAGSYSLEVSQQLSQVTVREGKATIFVSQDAQLGLGEKQRGIVGTDRIPVGPLSPQRDLITNGRFLQPLEQGWHIRTDATDSSQPAGEVRIVSNGGQETVQLAREGIGHAETGIYQILNENVASYQSLQLHLSAWLNYQSLGVCGAVGSECPLMVRITYKDSAGSIRQWVQGFYYWVDPAASNPTLCETCPPPRQEHEQHSQGTQFFYDSPNLMALLSQNGSRPASIDEIAVYASGHTYDVQVGEIELLVEE